MVSSASTTGAQKSFDEQKQEYFHRINSMNLRNPRMIGFGISNRQTLETSQQNAAGAIIGSKFVQLLEEAGGDADKLVYTGALDEYFNYCLGKLDWRTVSFKTRIEDTPNYQGNAVVNYTSHNEPYTRVIEHKHFEMFGQEVYDCPKTVVSEEYSTEYKEGMEQFYPVNDERNNALAEQYRKLAEQEADVIFGGRLGQYRYFDMAPVIEQVLSYEL